MNAPTISFTPAPGSPWRAVDAAPDATLECSQEFRAINFEASNYLTTQGKNLSCVVDDRLNFGNKKPGAMPGVLNFSATEAPPRAPVAIHSQATERPMNNEIFN